MKTFVSSFILIALLGCNSIQQNDLKLIAESYLEAKSMDDGSADKFTTDTLKIWFENKSGDPIRRIKGQKKTGPWAEWDKEFKSYSEPDSLWTDVKSNSVSGKFFESNEFYGLIGKPPTETTRTFWFNTDNLISEILIVWKPGQKTSDYYLRPIVEWALKNDSLEITSLYPKEEIKPSAINAKRWRKLIIDYKTNQSPG